MKKLQLCLALVIAIGSFLTSDVFTQSRASGQMVVPYGWENRDSRDCARLALLRLYRSVVVRCALRSSPENRHSIHEGSVCFPR